MSRKKDNIDLMGASLLIMCSAIVGINQVIIKIVNSGLQPIFQAGLRSVCAFLPVLLFAWLMNKPLTLRDGSFWPGILAGVFFSFEFMLLFMALEFTTVSRASILFYTMPIWAAVIAHFFIPGDQLNFSRVVGLILAISGIFLALYRPDIQLSSQAFVGDLMCLIASFLWAGIIFLAKRTAFSKSCPEMQLLYQLAVSGIILMVIAPVYGDLIREVNMFIILLFLVQVIVVVSFSFLAWFWLLSVYPASKVASFSFLAPVFGVLFGWIILDEVLSQKIILSLLLVSIGVYLVSKTSTN